MNSDFEAVIFAAVGRPGKVSKVVFGLRMA